MGRISFNPTAKSIPLRLKVGSINADRTRDILVVLDTGTSTTMIPPEVATDLVKKDMTSQTQMTR